MSRAWTLAYVQTSAPVDFLFAAVIRATRAELDGKLYRLAPGSFRYERFRESAAVRFSESQDLADPAQPGIVVYPQKNGLYSLWVTGLICGPFVSGLNPVSRAALAGRRAGPEDSIAVCLPRFFAYVSRALRAQIALVVFETNPSVDATAILFFDEAEMVGDYYHLLLEGERDTLCLPVDPGAIERLLDGRFAFVLEPYRLYNPDWPEGPARFFSPEEFGSRKVHEPETAAYDPDVSRLFVPFWEEDFRPYGAVYLSP